ncbi:DUF6456 domain-containing protein [Vitreimonas sp.]|uniref:DUF6456 domain-containing protein n=1 Tax=Vitreimonas sp. TaxID=3069702 RepID=UPI002D79C4B6|nr:DUF6456 domain-containing protein [Vitreimonas sp.]
MKKTAAAPVVAYDPDRATARLRGALAGAGVETADVLAEVESAAKAANDAGLKPNKQQRKVKQAVRRAVADIAQPMNEAERLGAALPPVRALLQTSWRVEQVDVPPGEEFIEALPAYVVKFDGNAPLERLRRAGVLEDHQVRAGEKVCALYLAAVKPPKVTGSYDGIIAQGGAAPRPWVEVGSDAWQSLNEALAGLLPNEAEAVMEVAVYETTIETLGRRRSLVRFQERRKAEAGVVQLLSCGLTRLAMHWGLVAGGPRDVPK